MIVLRRKQYALGTGNIMNAISGLNKKGVQLTAKQRFNQAALGVGKLGLTGAAIYGTVKGVGATKDALKGEMGEED